MSILENRRENCKLNALFVVVLVLESKALYLQGMRCIVYDITIFRPYEYDKREFSNNSTHTLGARGFLCAVSGFGQVLKSNRREKVRTRVGLRPTKRSSPFTREKSSGTQGTQLGDRFRNPPRSYPKTPFTCRRALTLLLLSHVRNKRARRRKK